MSIIQILDDRLPYKFATTLIFTNGRCHFCKKQIYEIEENHVKTDIEKEKEYFKKHENEYKRSVDMLGL